MAVVFEYAVPAALPAAYDGAQLHDELLAAGVSPVRVSSRTEVVPDPDPEPPPASPSDTLATVVVVEAPDGTARAAVDAVVAAHAPRVRYDPAARLRAVAALRREAGHQALVERARAATTVADLRTVLLAHLQEETP